MTWFKKIDWRPADKRLLTAVRGHAGGEWSTEHQAVRTLRQRLLDLQNWRCVYCQAPIEADENGYREVDHILPKKPSNKCTVAKGMSNDKAARRVTLGYETFTYEPLNLAVCCKQCNTYKGTYDPLLDRSQVRPLAAYPGHGDFLWVHPQLHQYSDHISIDEHFIFTAITESGRQVISVCRLDCADVLERKFLVRAQARGRHADSVKNTVESLVAGVRTHAFARQHAIQSLVGKFMISEKDAEQLYQLASSAMTVTDLEALTRACLAIEGC